MADIIGVPGVGTVTLQGTGPWRVQEISRAYYGIIDSEGRSARPAVERGVPSPSGQATKSDSNQFWANRKTPDKIVELANAKVADAV